MLKIERCPFCNALLEESLQNIPKQCSNKKCRSYTFIPGNRVQHRFNQDLGIGIISEILYYLKKKKNEIYQDSNNQFSLRYKKKINKNFIPSLSSTSDYILVPEMDIHESNSPKSFSKDQFFEKIIIQFKAYSSQSVYPQEIVHFLWPIGQKIRFYEQTSFDGPINSSNIKIGIIQNRNLHHADGIIRYQVQLTNGENIWIKEQTIKESVKNPIEEFYDKQLSFSLTFLLRIWSLQFLDLYSSNYIKIVTNSRLSLLPHQVSVAHHLLQQNEARMILADEVGLGKTIEAGIYIKEMIARRLARRILIITPASLSSQWEFEMENKFNLSFIRLDSQRLKQTEINFQTGNFINKKTGEEYTLCSVTLQFARLSQCSSKLLKVEWDIVIFDEAHHLRRYLTNVKTELYRTTLAYDLAEKLAQKSHNLLLLTATPIQLHSFDLYSLICLLNPYRFPTFDSFESERKNLVMLNLVISQLLNFSRISAFERRSLIYNILNFLPNFQVKALDENLKKKSFRTTLVQTLEKKHFLSDFVIRNRRKRVFPHHKIKRIPKIIDVTLTPKELEIYNKIHLYLAKIYSQNFEGRNTGMGFIMVILQKLLTSSVPAILKSLQRRINYLEENKEMLTKFQTEIVINQEFQEEEVELDLDLGIEEFELEDRLIYYRRKQKMKPKKGNELNIKDHIKILKEFVVDLKSLTIDSKAEKLQEIIKEILSNNPKEKIIIFTQFKATLFYLSKIFQDKKINVAHFHGDLNENQKNREVQKFKTTHSILLSTEIGGEGRNFQFCHIIINYDLPWNPMRLEQRIGRLDRIGQTKDILIYNFYIADTVESSIVTAIIDRIHLFEESIGSLEPILGSIEKQITDLVLREDEIPYKFRLEEVISKTTDKIEEVYAKLDDFILDKKSFQTSMLSQNLQDDNIVSHEDILQFFQTINDLAGNDFSITMYSKKSTNYSISLFSNAFNLIKTKKYDSTEFWQICLSDRLRSQVKCTSRKYEGTFSMKIAQRFEEFDFFALGHELVMNLADFCARDDFSGYATQLHFDSSKLINLCLKNKIKLTSEENLELQKILKNSEILHLFFIELKSVGIIIEKIIFPVLVSNSGLIFSSFTKVLYHPSTIVKVLDFSREIKNRTFDKNLFEQRKILQLYEIALQGLKKIAQERTKYLTQVNKTKYLREKVKIITTAKLKRKYLEFHLDKLQTMLRVKKVKLPTERQLQNVAKISELEKKNRRMKQFEQLKNEVQYLEQEIKHWEKELEELEFDIPAKLKKLEYNKKLRINAELKGYAGCLLL
ncbi:helicase-related protein [Candidatus Harpocratesius sp.]